MTTALLPIDNLWPDPDNPRAIDAERFALVEVSLQKLGWLSPAIVDIDSKILSGHQRIEAAKRLGVASHPILTLESHISDSEYFLQRKCCRCVESKKNDS